MRELKRNVGDRLGEEVDGRTPPGVRELKPYRIVSGTLLSRRRTPPGVRELKLLRPPLELQ